MRTGSLTERITLLRPSVQVNALGESRQTFEDAVTVHADRANISGRLSAEAGELFPDYSARFVIRIMHAVAEGWRVRDLSDGGKLYTVTNIYPNRHLQMKTLVCERVNE